MARIDLKNLSWGDTLRIGVPLLAVILLAFYVTSRFVQPAPPSHVVLSTGAPGGAYERYAKRYQAFFARNGVVLELRPSGGAVENMKRLDGGSVDAAFVQGGIATPVDEDAASPIVSLGALYLEPVWVFARDARKSSDQLRNLAGRRIAIGAEGSGTQPLARMLLDTAGIDAKDATLLPLSAEQASAALAQGTIDAAVLIAGVSAPVVGELVRRPEVEVINLVHAQAIARQHAYMTPLTIPRGLVDIRADLPDHDVGTVAVTANLLVRADLHPALMYLFLDAASEIHGRQTLLADAGRFPNPSRQEFPLSDEAERFYKSGKPFLQRYLPFWVANLADRMLVFLIPLIAVLLPTIRFLPDIIAYRPRARIAALYAKLRALEHEIASTRDVARIPEYVERLDAIEAEVTNTKLPGWYAQDVYALRAAIDLVRERLGRPGAKAIPGFRS
ncbi:MAG: TAXI family TRAP transporter solute-binding subunit [Casimicrobiaceae bacterium]